MGNKRLSSKKRSDVRQIALILYHFFQGEDFARINWSNSDQGPGAPMEI